MRRVAARVTKTAGPAIDHSRSNARARAQTRLAREGVRVPGCGERCARPGALPSVWASMPQLSTVLAGKQGNWTSGAPARTAWDGRSTPGWWVPPEQVYGRLRTLVQTAKRRASVPRLRAG